MALQMDLFDKTANEVMAAASYDEFKRRLLASGCGKCALAAGRTNIVVDRGSSASRIMVVGEGPGAQEDARGLAFVGKAGQLLDKIMESVGLDTDADMLICNVVKCRPPENRTPHSEEVEACIPYLRRQIELAAPEIILLLGATALQHIDKNKKNFSMKDEAGRFFTLPDHPGVRFMVLYHPAALLYNSGLKSKMWEHVKRLREHLGATPKRAS